MEKAFRWQGVGESPFSSVTRQANALGAVNLAQGFPDSPGPSQLLNAIGRHLFSCSNQYAPSMGATELLQALEERAPVVLPASRFMVTAGATEGVFCVLMGIINPGERVLCFEPFYESHRAAVLAAGGVFVPVRLLPPDLEMGTDWQIDWSDFDAAASLPFRCLILNTPHNPSGFVLDAVDFERLLSACRRYGAAVVSDEVYEHLVFEGEPLSLLEAASASDYERCVRVSSIAKSLGFTGFKIGWIQGSASIVDAAARVHEAVMFCVPLATQLGVADFLSDQTALQEHVLEQRETYRQASEVLVQGLRDLGLEVLGGPRGGYFLSANFGSWLKPGESDLDLSQRILREARVALLPMSGFCLPLRPGGLRHHHHHSGGHPLHGSAWMRLAFCKQMLVLNQALENLSKHCAREQNSFAPGS